MAESKLTENSDVIEAMKALVSLVEEHADTILNALGNQSRRMNEAADMANEQNQPHYAKVFRDDGRGAFDVMTGLSDHLESLAESRQENFADQG